MAGVWYTLAMDTNTPIRTLTLQQLQAEYPAAHAAWVADPPAPIEQANFTVLDDLLGADAPCDCNGGSHRHPYTWCPEINDWDAM